MKNHLHLIMASAMIHGIAGNIVDLVLPDARLGTLLMLLVLVAVVVSAMKTGDDSTNTSN